MPGRPLKLTRINVKTAADERYFKESAEKTLVTK
jgi:hypothetical protein